MRQALLFHSGGWLGLLIADGRKFKPTRPEDNCWPVVRPYSKIKFLSSLIVNWIMLLPRHLSLLLMPLMPTLGLQTGVCKAGRSGFPLANFNAKEKKASYKLRSTGAWHRTYVTDSQFNSVEFGDLVSFHFSVFHYQYQFQYGSPL